MSAPELRWTILHGPSGDELREHGTRFLGIECIDVVPASLLAEVEAERDRLRRFAFGDAPEWEKANVSLKHRVRELEAKLDEATSQDARMDIVALVVERERALDVVAASRDLEAGIGIGCGARLQPWQNAISDMAEPLRAALAALDLASPNGSTAGTDSARPRTDAGRASRLDEVGDFKPVDGIELVRDSNVDLFPENHEDAKRLLVEAVEHFRSFVERSQIVHDLVGDVLDTYDDSERERDADLAVDEARIDAEERAA